MLLSTLALFWIRVCGSLVVVKVRSGAFESVAVVFRVDLLRCLRDPTLLLKRVGHLGDSRRYLFEEELDDELSFALEEHLEVLDDHFARRVTLDADSQNVLLDLLHGRRPHQFFVLVSEHGLNCLLQLGELLQVFVYAHDLLTLKSESVSC